MPNRKDGLDRRKVATIPCEACGQLYRRQNLNDDHVCQGCDPALNPSIDDIYAEAAKIRATRSGPTHSRRTDSVSGAQKRSDVPIYKTPPRLRSFLQNSGAAFE